LVELSARNATALEHRLQETYPFRILEGAYIHGKGLLSQYRILASKRLRLASGRPYLAATLAVDAQQVSIVVVHPAPPLTRRGEALQARDLTLVLQRTALDRPTVLLGDFNCVARSDSYRLLAHAGLIDTFRAVGVGRGLTFPTRYQYAPLPLPRFMRIDYIWATPHFVPVASYVGPHVGSDHLPVISQLALPRNGTEGTVRGSAGRGRDARMGGWRPAAPTDGSIIGEPACETGSDRTPRHAYEGQTP
jgi:endonuclease/exonuclease/phosphatase family metal-dependent hydrolase